MHYYLVKVVLCEVSFCQLWAPPNVFVSWQRLDQPGVWIRVLTKALGDLCWLWPLEMTLMINYVINFRYPILHFRQTTDLLWSFDFVFPENMRFCTDRPLLDIRTRIGWRERFRDVRILRFRIIRRGYFRFRFIAGRKYKHGRRFLAFVGLAYRVTRAWGTRRCQIWRRPKRSRKYQQKPSWNE